MERSKRREEKTPESISFECLTGKISLPLGCLFPGQEVLYMFFPPFLCLEGKKSERMLLVYLDLIHEKERRGKWGTRRAVPVGKRSCGIIGIVAVHWAKKAALTRT
jgi:hypothetical protein